MSGSTEVLFPKLLTPCECAKLLRVAVGTLAVWRCTKRYPLPYLKLGHAVRYRTADVEKFLQEVPR
jgi:hypothetical protein